MCGATNTLNKTLLPAMNTTLQEKTHVSGPTTHTLAPAHTQTELRPYSGQLHTCRYTHTHAHKHTHTHTHTSNRHRSTNPNQSSSHPKHADDRRMCLAAVFVAWNTCEYANRM